MSGHQFISESSFGQTIQTLALSGFLCFREATVGYSTVHAQHFGKTILQLIKVIDQRSIFLKYTCV